jgi:hypothetical protein
MRFNEIQKKAKGMNINTFHMKKTDMIRLIQRSEHNIECYGTDRVIICNEDGCLWRVDCLSLNEISRQGHNYRIEDC